MEWVSGNIVIRPMMIGADAGTIIEGHKHSFDHTTFVWGGVKVNAVLPDGRQIEREFHGFPAHFLTRAGVEHRIEALSDGTTAWCVYSHRTPQGDVVQHFTGWPKAYD